MKSPVCKATFPYLASCRRCSSDDCVTAAEHPAVHVSVTGCRNAPTCAVRCCTLLCSAPGSSSPAVWLTSSPCWSSWWDRSRLQVGNRVVWCALGGTTATQGAGKSESASARDNSALLFRSTLVFMCVCRPSRAPPVGAAGLVSATGCSGSAVAAECGRRRGRGACGNGRPAAVT